MRNRLLWVAFALALAIATMLQLRYGKRPMSDAERRRALEADIKASK